VNNSTPPEALHLDVYAALHRRKSIRAFRPDPVPRASIERILAAAARAPSGTNIQPWQVRVLTGAARQRLVDAVLAFRTANSGVENWAYPYYPAKWKEPYLARRRKVGWDLYGLLGIKRSDTDLIRAQHNRNFAFFDAPVGLIFTIDGDLERGSWLDYGMFIQSVLLAAEADGLGTCPQACWVAHPDIVASTLAFAATEQLVCGVALGYPDWDAPVNQLTTERAALDDFVTFVDA
jgi:nitroreductase